MSDRPVGHNSRGDKEGGYEAAVLGYLDRAGLCPSL